MEEIWRPLIKGSLMTKYNIILYFIGMSQCNMSCSTATGSLYVKKHHSYVLYHICGAVFVQYLRFPSPLKEPQVLHFKHSLYVWLYTMWVCMDCHVICHAVLPGDERLITAFNKDCGLKHGFVLNAMLGVQNLMCIH